MATHPQKGSVMIESLIFLAALTLTLYFWIEIKPNNNYYQKLKNPRNYQNSYDFRSLKERFLIQEKLLQLQETQIQSLKQYEVKK